MPYLSTIAPFGFDDLPTPVLLGLARDLGCVSAQFYRNPQNPPDLNDARRLAEDTGLPFDSIHGLFGSHLDPSSPEEGVRRQTMETYRCEADLAVKIGGPRVVVHPSPLKTDDIADPHGSDQREGALINSLEELAKIGRAAGVMFLIENMPPNSYFGSDPHLLAQMLRRLDSDSVRLCFDTGHANMAGDPVPAVLEETDLIAAGHLNDNDGRTDGHLLPGEGTCPWESLGARLGALGQDVALALEVFPIVPKLRCLVAEGYGERLASWLRLPAASQNRNSSTE